MSSVNHQVTLVSSPVGIPKESDFQLIEGPIPRAGAGEALVRALYLAVDPYLRPRMSARALYPKPMQPGDVVTGGVVGQVVESNDPRVAKDDIVEGMLGWQEYAVAPAKSLRKLDPGAAPITTALYVLGAPGLTAYFGLLDICRPQPGETVLVSGAGGAIGSIVGQIAKIKRCRSVGVVGSNDKVRFITRELGFDGGFNSRDTEDYAARLKELCPNGIDIYFDSIGGRITDEVMRQINTKARVAVCDQLSMYSAEEPDHGPRYFSHLVLKQAKIEGFVVQQFADRFEEGLRQLSTWLREKKLKYHEDIVEGLENAPRALIEMLEGQNVGKRLVKVAA
jgi:NADPH-dependent curcumin reductase CurA